MKREEPVYLWHKGCWVGFGWQWPEWNVKAIMTAVSVVDNAIDKARGA